jgi:hypothetical protein
MYENKKGQDTFLRNYYTGKYAINYPRCFYLAPLLVNGDTILCEMRGKRLLLLTKTVFLC